MNPSHRDSIILAYLKIILLVSITREEHMVDRLQKIFQPKMPFFVSQNMQISSKTIDFASFLPLEYAIRGLLLQHFHQISMLYSSQFVASVESL